MLDWTNLIETIKSLSNVLRFFDNYFLFSIKNLKLFEKRSYNIRLGI